jgi:glycosidase
MQKIHPRQILIHSLGLIALAAALLAGLFPATPVLAGHTPAPTSVTVAGSLQSELGCAGDWDPACSATFLDYDSSDGVWQKAFDVPAGNWEYKAALNGSWDENYGLNAQGNGANIPLSLANAGSVKFYYDHKTHWITSNANAVIATVPGSFQSELGCPGDWDPGCLRSWLQDPDGDGSYAFTTTEIPAGNYEAKVAINESWDENYGAGGAQNGANIPFSVPANGSPVTFTYNPTSHILDIQVEAADDVQYFGLGHNSHDTLYRLPFGAITPGTELLLRFRTYHDDVTGVRARFYDTAEAREFFQELELVASDVSCYDPAQPDAACDFWQTALTPDHSGTLYYRFIVRDGSAVAYYADDRFFNGGWGEASPAPVDNSYAVTVYEQDFAPLDWLQNGVIYQIFPDRFRDGRSANNPSPTEPRYGYPPEPLDQILNKAWGDLPEGYCRHYTNPAEPCTEGPRGRDYFGGDLRGVQQRLNYLADLGATAIYFNPIFEAGSNHAYDTQDYYKIDHFFGTNKEFQTLVREAQKHGIRIILDGVFNHVSSDSAYFDRYGHFSTVGACEDPDSPYRDWFTFRPAAVEGEGACTGDDGTPNTMDYEAWFGFDSLPVLDKSNPEVQALFYGTGDAVGQYWLGQGSAGWRLDVMGDPSFPADFWPEFRSAVKGTDPQAAIIGELWKKHEILAENQGDTADTSMNYRFRNAILGFFGKVDNKGFPDDGQSDQPPSLFAEKLVSIREDNPDAFYYTLMNLMDSHDTQRILWSLTPGQENREEKEFNAANLEQGKQLLRLATVVQMTIPGAPTIYYGDEIGMTGADDPDDRRSFPWNGTGDYGHGGDQALLDAYEQLVDLRKANPVFRQGELTFLLVDDSARTLAYLMRTVDSGAIVAINRSDSAQTLAFSLGGLLPDGVVLNDALGGLSQVAAAGGELAFELPALSAAILLPAPGQDLQAPPAPDNLVATEGNAGTIDLSWSASSGADSYRVYRSPLTGGGYLQIGETAGISFSDVPEPKGVPYYYVVRAVDAAGNLGPASNEASGIPHYAIGWANLQWPPAITHTISAVNRTENVYGQVWIDGVTSQPGATSGLRAQLGYGPDGSDPAGNPDWIWVEAAFNVDAGNNDEFVASLLPDQVGNFDYAYRYTTTNGRDWVYADLDGIGTGYSSDQAGSLTVNPSDDTTPPAAPANLRVTAEMPSAVALAWDPVEGDASLYGYEVLRGDEAGGPYDILALVTSASYVDTDVLEGKTYHYVVLAVDQSFNRSELSNKVSAIAGPRTVTVTLNVTVPANTPADWTVHIAGTLSQLDGGYPDWDPGAVAMSKVDATHWTITFTGKEGTSLAYKYTLGSWDYVEKGVDCEELADRTLTLDFGSDGTQTVNDTVANWRNVSPCGG